MIVQLRRLIVCSTSYECVGAVTINTVLTQSGIIMPGGGAAPIITAGQDISQGLLIHFMGLRKYRMYIIFLFHSTCFIASYL